MSTDDAMLSRLTISPGQTRGSKYSRCIGSPTNSLRTPIHSLRTRPTILQSRGFPWYHRYRRRRRHFQRMIARPNTDRFLIANLRDEFLPSRQLFVSFVPSIAFPRWKCLTNVTSCRRRKRNREVLRTPFTMHAENVHPRLCAGHSL
jgi:hypothetical protein